MWGYFTELAVNMDIKIAKISTFYKYFKIQLLTAVSKEHVLVFYSKI